MIRFAKNSKQNELTTTQTHIFYVLLKRFPVVCHSTRKTLRIISNNIIIIIIIIIIFIIIIIIILWQTPSDLRVPSTLNIKTTPFSKALSRAYNIFVSTFKKSIIKI
jgi:hypothetical protein